MPQRCSDPTKRSDREMRKARPNGIVVGRTPDVRQGNRMKMKMLLVVVALVAAGCSASGEFSVGTPSVEDQTEDLIEGDIANQIGLGDLNATCTKPASDDVGSRFLCTAATEDGRTVEFQAVIEEDGAYAETTNVIIADKVDDVEAVIVAELENASGTDLADDAVDCGDGSIIVDDQNEFVCAFTSPSGDVFDVTVTFSGLDTDNPTFGFQVADEPRTNP